MNEIFKGLKVVELASVLARPAVGMFFAELGAEVLKIENKRTGGDVTRGWHISSEDTTKTAAYYYAINYNKKVELLDLSVDTDYAILLNHLQDADILISNFSEETSQKLRVDYKLMQDQFPTLIYAQLTGFLSDANRLAYDIVLQAETGFLSMCGENSANKARMPVALIDILAAHQLKEGILIALLQRHKTGKGSKVESTLEESAIASLANQATNYLMANHIAIPLGTKHPNIAPYGDIFCTLTGDEIVLSVGSDKQFEALCAIIELPSLADDDRFSTNAQRVINRNELIRLLAGKIQNLETSTFMTLASAAKVPVGHIKTIKQVLDGKVGRSMILESDDGGRRVSTVGFRLKS